MKRLCMLAVAALLLSAQTGCLHHNARHDGQHPGAAPPAVHPAGCNCGGGGGGLLGGRVSQAMHETQGWRHQTPQVGPPGPPVGTYAYPYYTLHGPRDFLADNPPSLGN